MINDSIRFTCTGCGRCCIGNHDRQVWLNTTEKQRLAAHLGLVEPVLEARHLDLVDAQWVVRLRPDGRCGFLDDTGACTVYEARPVQCQTYPFWPEIMKDRQQWEAEARYCEGINQGEEMNKSVVQASLRRQRARDAGL